MLYIYYENVVFLNIVKELHNYFICKKLQCEITTTIKPNNYADLYIILGMNDFNSEFTPSNYIVYQLEQTTGNIQSKWFTKTYINYMKNAICVWDYSKVNCKNLRKLGIQKTKYVPLQYMSTSDMSINIDPSDAPECTTAHAHPDSKTAPLESEIVKDIDILFLGSMNERRRKILDELSNPKNGLNVVIPSRSWGKERDDLIKRSKLILNIHYYDRSLLETARLSYLLSNRCLVVSETSLDKDLDEWHKPYVVFSEYNNLINACLSNLSNLSNLSRLKLLASKNTLGLHDNLRLDEYSKYPFRCSLDTVFSQLVTKYEYLIKSTSGSNQSSIETASGENAHVANVGVVIDSSDLFEPEYEITPNKEFILKLPKFKYEDLPHVSIVTVTYNRKHLFPMALRNWELFEYPRDKLEWIIVDDSPDDKSDLTDLLPKIPQVKYYRLKTTGRLSIGQKRNFGVDKSSYSYIAFMDDDDYYYPLSIYARIGLLLKYPKYDLVGVTKLDIYDINNEFCARIDSKCPYISEASMAFKKSFWQEQKFPDKFSTLGEGHPFTKNRRNRIINMCSCFNLIAMTHSDNYTQTNRSFTKFNNVEKKDDLLKILDFSTRMFILDLFDTNK